MSKMVAPDWRSGIAALAFAAGPLMVAPAMFTAPSTPVHPVVDTMHGISITDRYRRLERGRDADVEQWTQAQHRATRAWLDENAPPVPGLREELIRYIDRDLTQPPFFKKGREFFLRTRRGEAQPKLYTRFDGEERVIFDPLALDPTGKTAMGAIVLNRDASRAAVATFANGSEITDYRIIDTHLGAQLGPLLPGVGNFSWARDETFAYVSPRTAQTIARQDPARCYRHRLGRDPREDVLLIAMQDAKDWCHVYEPEEAEVTVFETGDFWSNTIRLRPLASTAEPVTIRESRKARAIATFRRDRMYFLTNDDFIAVAEYLVRERFTAPSRLGIAGGSNGGLLVGAALTQRPDLFGAALCSVPLLDMLRCQRFLIARYWF